MAVVYPYVKNPTWADGSGGGTSIDAADLNAIEDGIYNMHLAPAVSAYHGTHSVADTTFVYLSLQSELFDQAGGAASTQHDLVTNNSRLTCRYAGVYQVSGWGIWQANASGYRSLMLQVNRTTNITQTDSPNMGALSVNQSLSGLYKLAVNDYVEMVAYQTSGGALLVTPSLMMVRVAEMATTGTALYPGSSTFPGSTTFPGGGPMPQVEVLYSTSDYAADPPLWTHVPVGKLRGYSISRGRETELDEFDAGTATITLDNRTRLWDPGYNAAIRPMNRWLIRVKHSGSTYDRFLGYADRYALTWPERGKDSVVEVSCTDEMKVLNLFKLPATNPPRTSYQEVVESDSPGGYWPATDPADVPGDGWQVAGTPQPFVSIAGTDTYTDNPLIGDPSESGYASFGFTSGSVQYSSYDASAAEVPLGDVSGANAFAVELWLNFNSAPAASYDVLWASPLDGLVQSKWQIWLDSSAVVSGWARNNAGTTYMASSGPLQANTWHHIVFTLDAGNLKLYVDGALAATTAFAGPFSTSLNTSQTTTMSMSYPTGIVVKMAQLAWYPSTLSAARVLAHYQAARQRGWPEQPLVDRYHAILDAASNHAPRGIVGSSGLSIQAEMMTGQAPLDELREVAAVEAPNGCVFVNRSGAVLLFYSNGRGSTVSATFDDAGNLLPNGDFAAGLTGWEALSGISLVTDSSVYGAAPPALRFQGLPATTVGAYTWPPFPMTAAAHRARFRVRVTVGAPYRIVADYYADLAGASWISDEAHDFVGTGSWETVDIVLAPPPGCVAADIGPYLFDAATLWADDIEVSSLDLRYLETLQDISETFLYNSWTVARKGGVVQAVSDATSIARYGERARSITDLGSTSDGEAATIAAAYLAKYKDPAQRIPSVSPDMANANACEAALARDITDLIRVIRRPLGGGSAIDQQSWIQKISESGKPGAPLELTFNVSPV